VFNRPKDHDATIEAAHIIDFIGQEERELPVKVSFSNKKISMKLPTQPGMQVRVSVIPKKNVC